MARKKSKLNFLDSLLGGFAQGFQLSQQFKSNKQKRDLEERKFGIQEQEVGFKERQLALQEQAAKDQQRKNLTTQKFLAPFLRDILQGSGQATQAPLPQQSAPAPTAQTRNQAISQPAPVTPDLETGPPILTDTSRPQPPIGEGFNPPTRVEPDVGLETTPQQDVSPTFPLFDAELQRIRQLQGLPSDLKVSGKGFGIPVEFSVVPNEKKVLTLLKRQFIEDQRGRGIEKFDILTFKGLLKDGGVGITDDFRKELEDEFKKQFREGTSGRALAHFKVGERGVRKAEFLRDLGAKFGLIPQKFAEEANLALAGDRTEVLVKLGNDSKTDRPIAQVGFALKDDPTDIIFIGKPTIAGAGTKITVKNLPQIPGILLEGITQSKLALKSVARIDDILKRVNLESLVGPLDAPMATLLEKLGFPNTDQQTIGNITRDLTDTLGRMRSGGVISPEEWETFTALVPQRSDPALTFVNKLNDFRAKMNDIVSVNLEVAKTFQFNVGTSDVNVGTSGVSDGIKGGSRLQQLLEERKRRAGTGG